MDDEQIRQVRTFNRAVTQRVGALRDDYLGRGRPLAESRLLFEIGEKGAHLRDLRARLSLDSGYLSRLLRALEAAGFVACRHTAGDARARPGVATAFHLLVGRGVRTPVVPADRQRRLQSPIRS